MQRRDRLGYAIRRAREKRGLTPPQLAERLGVARGTINEWESAKSVPSMLYLGPLCSVLDVDPRLFADLPPEPASPVDDYLLAAATAAVLGPPRRSRRGSPEPPGDGESPQ
jgi:transcriptional regulator with XRE-family HTH domain